MKKIINKLATKLNIQIIVFLFLMPFIDTYDELIGGRIEILGISVIEIIKILIINYLLFLAIFTNWRVLLDYIKKHKIIVISSVLIMLIFIVGHLYNVYKLDPNLVNGLSNNFIMEAYYIYRTYGLCLLFFMAVFLTKMEKDKVIKYVSLICLIISLIIVLSNIFKIGYIAYDSTLEKSTPIAGSIFDWGKINYTNADAYTTKGWFFSTNQLSLVLVVTLMLSTLYLVKEERIVLYLTYPIKLLACLLVSTKTCFFALFISLGMVIVIAPAYKLLKHEKLNYPLIIYAFLLLVAFRFIAETSPANYRLNLFMKNQNNYSTVASDIKIDLEDINDINDDEDDEDTEPLPSDITFESLAKKENLSRRESKLFVKQLNMYFKSLGIHKLYIDIYPVAENLKFWQKAVLLPQNGRTDFRHFKYLMYQDILKKNDNLVMDMLFGYGYVSKVEYMEKDYIGQVVWFGIIGTIALIGIYLLTVGNCIIAFLKNIKKHFTIDNIFFFALVFEYLGISYIAGYGFGNLFPFVYFVIALKILYDNLKLGEKHEKGK